MKKLKVITCLVLVFTLVFSGSGYITASASLADKAVITVDGGKGLKEISKNLFGIFFEDINFSADGGISANLIRNNSFEQRLAWDLNWDCRMTGWEVTGGSGGLRGEEPMNENNPSYFHADTACTVVNFGYPDRDMTLGILLKKGETYDLSFYVRGSGNASFAFIDAEENSVFSKDFTIDSRSFEKKTFAVSVKKDVFTKLAVTLPEGADIDFYNLIAQSSFGYGDPVWKYSTLRRDLVDALNDLHPAFMRFPGGCLAEGAYDWSMAYNWKTTIGEPESRKQIPNIWGYNQSLAVGFYEYFCLCDYLDAEPLPVIHAGLMCQGRGDWKLEIGSDEFNAHIQDIIDLVEYANGDTSTEWGAVRAENGHPEPFNLKYVAIGNENWMEDYWERFDVIYNAVKEACPGITIISSAGAWADGREHEYAWEQINEKYTDTVVDEHYYVPPAWPVDNYEKYDNYSRDGAKVFVGEYAVHRGGGDQITKNNLQVAIAEAVHCTALVRNGDIVELACYAPLFARDNYTQWAPNLIWYNSDEVIRTPSYYVQQLFMNNTGTAVAESKLTGSSDGIYQAVSVDPENKNIYVAAVNLSAESKRVSVKIDGFGKIDPVGEMRYLGSGLFNVANKFGPFSDFISPEYQKVTAAGNTVNKILGPNSCNIICLSYGGENNFASPVSSTGYSAGSTIRTLFYDVLAKIVVWFTATKLYMIISDYIKGTTEQP